jgi:hypothetical protein
MRVGWIEEGGRQVLWSAARRALAVLPFFLLAGVVLGRSGPAALPPEAERRPLVDSPVIIATSTSLRPAFAALEEWNRKQGCASYLLLVDDGAMSASPEGQIAYVGALCARWGMAGILLGGDARHVPASFPDGVAGQGAPGSPLTWIRFVPGPEAPGPTGETVPVRRVVVRDLDEAWAFVDACRAHGQTLDEIVGGGISDPVAGIREVE